MLEQSFGVRVERRAANVRTYEYLSTAKRYKLEEWLHGLLGRMGLDSDRDVLILVDGTKLTVERLSTRASLPAAGAARPVAVPLSAGDAPRSAKTTSVEPRGKDVTIHGVSVRATRKPRLMKRFPESYLKRMADRRNHGPLTQEPPRTTRRPHSPRSHARPSVGAPR